MPTCGEVRRCLIVGIGRFVCFGHMLLGPKGCPDYQVANYCIVHFGCVYETFGISKHFPVKLQVLLIRAETLDIPLTAKCFIYDVVCSF